MAKDAAKFGKLLFFGQEWKFLQKSFETEPPTSARNESVKEAIRTIEEKPIDLRILDAMEQYMKNNDRTAAAGPENIDDEKDGRSKDGSSDSSSDDEFSEEDEKGGYDLKELETSVNNIRMYYYERDLLQAYREATVINEVQDSPRFYDVKRTMSVKKPDSKVGTRWQGAGISRLTKVAATVAAAEASAVTAVGGVGVGDTSVREQLNADVEEILAIGQFDAKLDPSLKRLMRRDIARRGGGYGISENGRQHQQQFPIPIASTDSAGTLTQQKMLSLTKVGGGVGAGGDQMSAGDESGTRGGGRKPGIPQFNIKVPDSRRLRERKEARRAAAKQKATAALRDSGIDVGVVTAGGGTSVGTANAHNYRGTRSSNFLRGSGADQSTQSLSDRTKAKLVVSQEQLAQIEIAKEFRRFVAENGGRVPHCIRNIPYIPAADANNGPAASLDNSPYGRTSPRRIFRKQSGGGGALPNARRNSTLATIQDQQWSDDDSDTGDTQKEEEGEWTKPAKILQKKEVRRETTSIAVAYQHGKGSALPLSLTPKRLAPSKPTTNAPTRRSVRPSAVIY